MSGTKERNRQGKSNRFLTIVLVVLMVIGVGFMAYPTISDALHSLQTDEAISDYQNAVDQLDETERQALLDQAHAYNQSLVHDPYRFNMDEAKLAEYESMMKVGDVAPIATVSVPSQKIYLPIYHGSSPEALLSGAGHLEGTSLPVGGPSTHTVISAHTGLPEAELFDNISNLKTGDQFVISALGEDHVYIVDRILTVLPEEMDALAIEEGEELCTLLTCTPYGINTHRLLVIGKKAPEGTPVPAPVDTTGTLQKLIPILLIAAVILICLVSWYLIRKRKKAQN